MRGLGRAFTLTPAKTSEVPVVPELVEADRAGWLIGDKGYRSKPLTQQLLQEQPPQRLPEAAHKRLVGMRRLIETVNGQLEQQFQINAVWVRDLGHLTGRIVRKLRAHAFCVLLNIRLGRDPLKLKALVA